MPYTIVGGIWVPCARNADPILLFIDEAYLSGQTGFVQSCVVVPRDAYQNKVVPEATCLLKRLGKDAKEFKASKIKPGNSRIYTEFLQLFVNHIAAVSDVSTMRSVVSVDAQGCYSGKNFQWLNPQVLGAMQNLGLKDVSELGNEFTRQVLWLYNHWPKIGGMGKYKNPLIITFDEKHKYAKQCKQMQFISAPGTPAILTGVHEVLTSFANCLFKKCLIPIRLVPSIKDFRFGWSPAEFGIQAADVLANLMYNSVLFNMGVKTPATSVRTAILQELMPGLNVPTALTTSMKRCGNEVVCTNSGLLSTFQLEPGP